MVLLCFFLYSAGIRSICPGFQQHPYRLRIIAIHRIKKCCISIL